MPRTLEEILGALNVTDATHVLFGKLPNVDPRTNPDALVFPTGDTLAAFSEARGIPISFRECVILEAAGARMAEQRPPVPAKRRPKTLSRPTGHRPSTTITMRR